jgi:hypothetical protein
MKMTIKELMAQVTSNSNKGEGKTKKAKFAVQFNAEEAKAKLAALPVNVLTECELIKEADKDGNDISKILHAIFWGDEKDGQRQYVFLTKNDKYGKTSGYFFFEYGIPTDKNHGIDEVIKANNIQNLSAEDLKLLKALRRHEIDQLKVVKPVEEAAEPITEEQPTEEAAEPITEEQPTEEEKPVQEIVPDVAEGNDTYEPVEEEQKEEKPANNNNRKNNKRNK